MSAVELPERLFHGTVFRFDSFEPGKNNGFTVPRKGVYLTDDLVTCWEFGHLVYEVAPEVKRPLDARNLDDDAVWEALERAIETAGEKTQAKWLEVGQRMTRFLASGGAQSDEFISALERDGYDALIFCDSWGRRGFDSFVVFDPANAKIVSMQDLSEVNARDIHNYDWDAADRPRP